MGWKGTLRTINAASKRAARQAERRRRELIQQQKEWEKLEAMEQAYYEFEVYENRIEVLKSVHKECGEQWDWEAIKVLSPPNKPEKVRTNERQAREKLDNYKPGFLDKMFNRAEATKAILQKEIDTAVQKDEQEYQEALRKYEEDYEGWEDSVEMANKILAGDSISYKQVIEEISPFQDIDGLGSTIEFYSKNPKYMEVELHIHSDDVIPNEVKQLTKTGKLSVKQMPKAQYFELYQDYVSSCVLRVARELLALLPLETVFVHAIGETLNSSTGHMEETSILSVMIPRQTLNKLNFETIDCSDSMSNFVHNMKFKKTKGFEPVEKLSVERYQNV